MATDPRLIKQALVDFPTADERITPKNDSFIFNVAQASQSITPWGKNYRLRDKELRALWINEPWLASVVYLVSIRNASFEWEIVGADPTKNPPTRTIQAATNILKSSNMGKGWENLVVKTCIDLYTQDNAAFWHIVRQDNRNRRSPVRMIQQLDSARCQRTGDPRLPVIYTDRFGKEHLLRYWQVRAIEEMPAPIENTYGLQYSAVSRALMAAEIIQSIEVYKKEKVDGSFTRAIDAITGVTKRDIDNAIAMSNERSLNKGLRRYSLPVIIPGIDPSSTLSHVHIDLASLPDNFDEDTSLKWYVAQLAAAFGVDYQEIAPLMTGNLGSSQQSEIMHLKTRGKGPALIMRLFENIINELLPQNVLFRFKEQDVRAETEKAEARFTRGKDRTMRVKSGELDVQAARRLAVKDGDLEEWMADNLDARADEIEQETQENEIQSAQMEGGIESGETKMLTQEHIQAFRDYISRTKISQGQPSGTVIFSINSTENILELQRNVAAEFVTNSVRMIPNGQLHITLVHSPLVEDDKFNFVADMLESRISDMLPKFVTASTISKFDTSNGVAVILKVDENEKLTEIQRELIDTFKRLNIAVSDTSENWIPHITLFYTDGEFEEKSITPLVLRTGAVEFSRSDFYSVRRIDHALDS